MQILIVIILVITAFAFGGVVQDNLDRDKYLTPNPDMREFRYWLCGLIDDLEDQGHPDPRLWDVLAKVDEIMDREVED